MRDLLLPFVGGEITAHGEVGELIHPRVDRFVKIHRVRYVASAPHALLVCFVADRRHHLGRERHVDLDHLEPELVVASHDGATFLRRRCAEFAKPFQTRSVDQPREEQIRSSHLSGANGSSHRDEQRPLRAHVAH